MIIKKTKLVIVNLSIQFNIKFVIILKNSKITPKLKILFYQKHNNTKLETLQKN